MSWQSVGAAIAASLRLLAAPPVFAAETGDSPAASTAGFAGFAAAGGTMVSDYSCFFNHCKAQTTDCFSNPACLKGVTCLGSCRGEQLCATQCFVRFGSERLNAWLSCTLEDQKCISTGIQQDTSKFYANAPPAIANFKPCDLEGK